MNPTPLAPELRRRNRRLALILCGLMVASAVFGRMAVRRGWIYPQDTTYAFPQWMK